MLDAILSAGVVVLPAAYLAAAFAYGGIFFSRRPLAERLAGPLLGAALAAHLGYLVALTLRWSQFPAATVSQTLSMIAFAIAAVYIFVEWLGGERSTGLWMVSLVFGFQLLASLLHRPAPPTPPFFGSSLFGTHVSLALLGYTACAVGGAYGFLFLELYRELKSGRFAVFYGRLPSLVVLERMMAGALWTGWAALAGAVITGGLWAQQLYPDSWLGDPTFLATVAIWVMYGSALVMRHLKRWHGKQTAVVSLAGLAAIVVSLLAVNYLLPGFHEFG